MKKDRSYLKSCITTGMLFFFILIIGSLDHTAVFTAHALQNGVAQTPPMGWNSWNKFRCGVSETLIKQMADAMVTSGMKDAGYQYVNIDDCWQTSRDASGKIVADTVRFPSGMKALADYMHAKGLKLGIYTDIGYQTCEGRPGSRGYYDQDASTYAEWGIDYVKVDWCYVDPASHSSGTKPDAATWYGEFRNSLLNSGRTIAYSICNWGEQAPWVWGAQTGNLWRTSGDIYDHWDSITSNISQNQFLYSYAGPGAWNDPDMLEVGNGGMTDTEQRSHFSLWSIMAAPLIAGNDISSMTQATKDILMNPEVIAVNQDIRGYQGRVVKEIADGVTIWNKRLLNDNERAVVLFNGTGAATNITVSWSDIGLLAGGATVRDLWAKSNLGTFSNGYTANVPSHGAVMLKVVGTHDVNNISIDDPAPTITITNTDDRLISNLKITTDFTINNALHTDYEVLDYFDQKINLDLNARNGYWNGTAWVGNFLSMKNMSAGLKELTIHRLDGRYIGGMTVTVEFVSNGAVYKDSHFIGDFNKKINLTLNGSGGSWNGTYWQGDFLK
ncbi:glycoside hydrolase family 27 protein [Paenibacillus sp. UMB4589-SE434]|uniref:glycoside hydrolase family 27 protein n=1 Tax=Paenibacillus sp. UMB4589-SE434 TaxID=3046314 RepID=UPI00254B6E7E|nr:glycoside hydrolase family 27 protein [Paenibacillus sp. UMB4589-SE434]MDK8181760.1 glycoside hydrolase family 27 protein [Paenibacillus sp. UMB4589-SE434]